MEEDAVSLPSVGEATAVSLPPDPDGHVEEHQPGKDDISLPSAYGDTHDESSPSLPPTIGSSYLAPHATGEVDIAELSSQPRVVPVANSLGLTGDISIDLKAGVDFMLERYRDYSIKLLGIRKVRFLVLSPPCTAFSPRHMLFNKKAMLLQKGK